MGKKIKQRRHAEHKQDLTFVKKKSTVCGKRLSLKNQEEREVSKQYGEANVFQKINLID